LTATIIEEKLEVKKTTALTGAYLGQTPPGDEPVLFAPGIVSTNAGNHSSPAFSPDGKELYWEMSAKIWFTKLENDKWSNPQMLPFCEADSHMYDNPFITPDGGKLFFTSTRSGVVSQKKETIWYVKRTASGWSEPKPISSQVNETPLHWSISVSDSGTLYFQFQCIGKDCSEGMGAIYYSKPINGVYTKPIKMGPEINTRHTETCPYIAPDESYIIFNRFVETDMKKTGLYTSYRDKSGQWLPAVFILGGSPDVGGVSPKISPDGKYLFFAQGDKGVWWMSATFVEELRPKE
jgi:hypothetical protein